MVWFVSKDWVHELEMCFKILWSGVDSHELDCVRKFMKIITGGFTKGLLQLLKWTCTQEPIWPPLHSAMNSPGWRGEPLIRRKWYLTAAMASAESCLILFMPVIKRIVDLSDFNGDQNSTAQRLRVSISETVRIVCYSWHTVVSTYAKRMNVRETTSRCHGVWCLRLIKAIRLRRLFRLVKPIRIHWLDQMRSQWSSCNNRIDPKLTV